MIPRPCLYDEDLSRAEVKAECRRIAEEYEGNYAADKAREGKERTPCDVFSVRGVDADSISTAADGVEISEAQTGRQQENGERCGSLEEGRVTEYRDPALIKLWEELGKP